jgi:hypothetical protein
MHGYIKLFFGLRKFWPINMEEASLLFAKDLHGMVKDSIVGGGHFFGNINEGWIIYLLGLGVGFVLDAFAFLGHNIGCYKTLSESIL